MSKYILNANTALILNEEVFALVREIEITTNNVCEKCSLNDICFDIHGSSNFYRLCTTEDGDGRWFFVRAWHLTKFQREELDRTISANINYF